MVQTYSSNNTALVVSFMKVFNGGILISSPYLETCPKPDVVSQMTFMAVTNNIGEIAHIAIPTWKVDSLCAKVVNVMKVLNVVKVMKPSLSEKTKKYGLSMVVIYCVK